MFQAFPGKIDKALQMHSLVIELINERLKLCTRHHHIISVIWPDISQCANNICQCVYIFAVFVTHICSLYLDSLNAILTQKSPLGPVNFSFSVGGLLGRNKVRSLPRVAVGSDDCPLKPTVSILAATSPARMLDISPTRSPISSLSNGISIPMNISDIFSAVSFGIRIIRDNVCC